MKKILIASLTICIGIVFAGCVTPQDAHNLINSTFEKKQTKQTKRYYEKEKYVYVQDMEAKKESFKFKDMLLKNFPEFEKIAIHRLCDTPQSKYYCEESYKKTGIPVKPWMREELVAKHKKYNLKYFENLCNKEWNGEFLVAYSKYKKHPFWPNQSPSLGEANDYYAICLVKNKYKWSIGINDSIHLYQTKYKNKSRYRFYQGVWNLNSNDNLLIKKYVEQKKMEQAREKIEKQKKKESQLKMFD